MSDPVEDKLWTAGEFLDWLEPGMRADLIRGTLFMHSPVSLKHARLGNLVHFLMSGFVETKGNGEVHRDVVAVQLSARNVLMPDIGYFTKGQVRLFKPAHVPVAPTIAVEILSPSSVLRDARDKFTVYEEHGVKEYWLLDPEHLRHRFYTQRSGFLVEYGAGEQVIHSKALDGFWLRRSWLDPERLPNFNRYLEEILASVK